VIVLLSGLCAFRLRSFVCVCDDVGFVLSVWFGDVVGDGDVYRVCSRLLEMTDFRTDPKMG